MSVKFHLTLDDGPQAKEFFFYQACVHTCICVYIIFSGMPVGLFFTVHILWFVTCMLDSRLRSPKNRVVHKFGAPLRHVRKFHTYAGSSRQDRISASN